MDADRPPTSVRQEEGRIVETMRGAIGEAFEEKPDFLAAVENNSGCTELIGVCLCREPKEGTAVVGRLHDQIVIGMMRRGDVELEARGQETKWRNGPPSDGFERECALPNHAECFPGMPPIAGRERCQQLSLRGRACGRRTPGLRSRGLRGANTSIATATPPGGRAMSSATRID